MAKKRWTFINSVSVIHALKMKDSTGKWGIFTESLMIKTVKKYYHDNK